MVQKLKLIKLGYTRDGKNGRTIKFLSEEQMKAVPKKPLIQQVNAFMSEIPMHSMLLIFNAVSVKCSAIISPFLTCSFFVI